MLGSYGTAAGERRHYWDPVMLLLQKGGNNTVLWCSVGTKHCQGSRVLLTGEARQCQVPECYCSKEWQCQGSVELLQEGKVMPGPTAGGRNDVGTHWCYCKREAMLRSSGVPAGEKQS